MHRFIGRIAKMLDVQHSCFGEMRAPGTEVSLGNIGSLQNRAASVCQSMVHPIFATLIFDGEFGSGSLVGQRTRHHV